MGMAIRAPRYTVADLDDFPNDGKRYELLDGVLFVTPAPANAHQVVASRLSFMLTSALGPSGDAQVVGPGAVRHLPTTHLEPDLLVYPKRFAPGTKWENIENHWLAIEILSRGSRVYDRDFKRDAYLALGVAEVWLVDMRGKWVDACREGKIKRHRGTIRWRVPTLDRIVAVDLDEVFEGLP